MDTYLKEDPELKRQMGALEGVSSKAAFADWKASFLAAIQQFLDQDGSIKAEEAYRKFNKSITSLEKINSKLQSSIDDGGLSVDRNPSVKARKALNELGAKLESIADALQLLLPGNMAEQVEYTNFHMGAILIREGFSSYAALDAADQHLQQLKQHPALAAAADRQLMESIERYRERLQAFCTIMADLGIMKICNKAQEVKQITDEPDPVENLEAFTPAIAEEPAEGPKKKWTPPPKQPAKKKETAKKAGKKALPRVRRSSKDEIAADDEAKEPGDQKKPKTKKPPARAKSMPMPEPTAEVSITAKHKKLKDLEEPDPTSFKRKIIRKKGQRPSVADKKDTTPDLEHTAAPTSPKRFSTNDSRGCGRRLSQEEAKEKKLPRTKSMPNPKLEALGDDDGEKGDSQEQSDKQVEGKPKDPPAKNKKGKENTANAAPAPKNGQQPPPNKGPSKSTTVMQEPAAPPPAPAKKADTKVTITVYFNDKQQEHKIQLQVDVKKDTLKSLKAQLEPKTGLKPEQQRICLRFLGNELTGPKPLSFYSIKDESELDLDPKTIALLVQLPNKTFTMEGVAPNSDTIEQLKARIETESGLAAARQSLFFKNNELPPRKTVKEMGIPNGAQIKVELFAKVPVTIHLVLENRKVQLMLDLTKDKLDDLKTLIETKTKVPKDNQRLFANKDCKDELIGSSGGEEKRKSLLKSMSFRKSNSSKKTFCRDFGIQEGSELYMEPKVIKVTIVMPDGKSYKPSLPPSSDMSVMIKALAELTKSKDLAGKNPVFKLGDKALPKGKTLKDAGMREGSKVKLELTSK
ncbi:Polyubiquitin (Fragment) [Seminavis robusta]|uniref:Polyubiquitin n=1 Tax=Seminavis robusta TaxID=568900 RepID=A0A9N8DJW2_9STRA